VTIPKLLDMLAIDGAIDAMGCQRAIARKILDKRADYVLALKDNQTTLREDVEVFVAEQKANGFQDATISRGRRRSHRNPHDDGHPRRRLAPRPP
jgi:predicted transposase YbfD/YdcC